jgi:hypothetical protein
VVVVARRPGGAHASARARDRAGRDTRGKASGKREDCGTYHGQSPGQALAVSPLWHTRSPHSTGHAPQSAGHR